jgi:acetate kinase
MTQVLVLNTGSSSIKYRLFEMETRDVLASGLLERIGEETSRLVHTAGTEEPLVDEGTAPDHRAGLASILAAFEASGGLSSDLAGIGHRVVHGGERFFAPTLIDDEAIDAIGDLIPLAPLHNPSNLLGIEVARAQFSTVPQVAVFDTAFHKTMPPHAYRYALPESLARELRIRRYGFHGTSHAYVSRAAAAYLGRSLPEINLITLHLGNGASVAAVAGGRCIDTSMGMTPLEGLVMGSRSGDLDPAIVFYLHREADLSIDEIDELLNKGSGMKGLTGLIDMRQIEQRAAEGDQTASEALDVYCYRIRKYIGAYAAALGRVDALVFTAGVGENSDVVRARVCQGLEPFGVHVDPSSNAARSGQPRSVSTGNSRVAVLVVPTNEELEIATQTWAVISDTNPTS